MDDKVGTRFYRKGIRIVYRYNVEKVVREIIFRILM